MSEEVWFCQDCFELVPDADRHADRTGHGMMYPVVNYGIFHAAFQKLILEAGH